MTDLDLRSMLGLELGATDLELAAALQYQMDAMVWIPALDPAAHRLCRTLLPRSCASLNASPQNVDDRPPGTTARQVPTQPGPAPGSSPVVGGRQGMPTASSGPTQTQPPPWSSPVNALAGTPSSVGFACNPAAFLSSAGRHLPPQAPAQHSISNVPYWALSPVPSPAPSKPFSV
eukprot:gene6695-6412_t